MLKNTHRRMIEWGECDPAGIVFYPRYFMMFDNATTLLISRASGLTKFQLSKKYGMSGYPMVDTQAKFHSPNRYGDEVTIESEFTRIGSASFDIAHRILRDGRLTAEGFEKRVWVTRSADDPDRIRSQPIPAELAARFRGETDAPASAKAIP